MNNKIQLYESLLLKWQKSINLISSKEQNVFQRHIVDSLQLAKFLAGREIIIDIGSGAGLPGIPLAIQSDLLTYLIESDRRKSIFLSEVIREAKINALVINQRIEVARIDGLSGKTIAITARALAELDKLFKLIQTFLENNRITSYKLILHKGAKVLSEIEKAQKSWTFDYSLEKSETNESAWILIIENFKPK